MQLLEMQQQENNIKIVGTGFEYGLKVCIRGLEIPISEYAETWIKFQAPDLQPEEEIIIKKNSWRGEETISATVKEITTPKPFKMVFAPPIGGKITTMCESIVVGKSDDRKIPYYLLWASIVGSPVAIKAILAAINSSFTLNLSLNNDLILQLKRRKGIKVMTSTIKAGLIQVVIYDSEFFNIPRNPEPIPSDPEFIVWGDNNILESRLFQAIDACSGIPIAKAWIGTLFSELKRNVDAVEELTAFNQKHSPFGDAPMYLVKIPSDSQMREYLTEQNQIFKEKLVA